MWSLILGSARVEDNLVRAGIHAMYCVISGSVRVEDHLVRAGIYADARSGETV